VLHGQKGGGNLTNLYSAELLAFAHHQDVRGFDISVHDPVAVQAVDTVQQLPHQRLDCVKTQPGFVLLVVFNNFL
jgi:hypothetical protein